MDEMGIAGKDLDFLKLQQKINVGSAIKAKILEQVFFFFFFFLFNLLNLLNNSFCNYYPSWI